MRAQAGAAYVHVCVDERVEAGAAHRHSHAQLYALDHVPAIVARERERFSAHAVRTMGGNLLEDSCRRRSAAARGSSRSTTRPCSRARTRRAASSS